MSPSPPLFIVRILLFPYLFVSPSFPLFIVWILLFSYLFVSPSFRLFIVFVSSSLIYSLDSSHPVFVCVSFSSLIYGLDSSRPLFIVCVSSSSPVYYLWHFPVANFISLFFSYMSFTSFIWLSVSPYLLSAAFFCLFLLFLSVGVLGVFLLLFIVTVLSLPLFIVAFPSLGCLSWEASLSLLIVCVCEFVCFYLLSIGRFVKSA